MATISTLATRVQILDVLISVDPRPEELERRLKESWPSDLADEKEELQNIIVDALVAESKFKNWKRASHQLHYCLGILIEHKNSIPQELMLWLVKRICVPLAFISQFRLRDLKLAYKALKFMLNFIWLDYDFGDRELTFVQVMLKSRVEAMAASVPYEYAKLRAQGDVGVVNSELDTSSELYKDSELLSTEECKQDDVKARCCDLLCVQYYRLGEIGNVRFWLREWQSTIECITDSRKKEFQKQECLLVEASLCAEYGTDDKNAEDLIQKLEELSSNLNLNEDDVFVESMQISVFNVIRTLRLGRSGDAARREEFEGEAQYDLMVMKLNMDDMKERMEQLRLHPDDTLSDLDRKVQRSMDSARHEDAIGYLQEMIDHVQRIPLYVNTPSKIASALGELRYNQASCHERLFRQKELKFFIDSMEKNREDSAGFSSTSLKLCAHHCWSPYCQHKSHGCPPEEEEEDDESLANLGHHELESPTDFFTKRHIESDGNNVPHLERATELLNQALDSANEAGSNAFYIAKVQSFLAGTHLLLAESKCRQLVRYESWPLPKRITPEFLVSNECYTIRQVRDYLKCNGTSPDDSFRLSHSHYRQCAKKFSRHLDSLKYYSEEWIHSIEKQKDLYVKLQHMLSIAIGFYMKLLDVLSELNLPIGELVVRREAELVEILANIVPEALLWSERARARFLELQLNRRVQQLQEIFPEPSSKDFSAFDSEDEVAWNVIRSSLDACGEGTVFLEYFFEDQREWMIHEKTLGRVYGVKKASGKIMEPLLMRSLPGDPMELQSLVEHLHKAMDPDRQYDEEQVIRDLERLYVLLITPHVAEFLKGMQHDHKLVICPSQIFTKVPFAALRNPAEKSRKKGYMFQSHTISITPSLRSLKYNNERYVALQKTELMEGRGASVAMGDPRYENESKWPRLETSGAEVESIESLFPNRCELFKYWDATVENLLKMAVLPSERSRSQAFVHIAAHCLTDDAAYKQGILKLTDPPHRTDMPSSSSSTAPVSSGGILSAENVVKSDIEWRARMIVLSACGSGKGEIKAEGVLNLPRAFMVAGVPCSVVSQWKVEDDSTAQLMKRFYQRMLKGVDVATALRSSMQEMLENGHNIKQWAPFMVWGLPTVCLPDELLSQDAGIVLLRSGEQLIGSHRLSDALLVLKKSWELMKAKKSHTEEESNALVWCLWWLADCEESSYLLAQSNEKECRSFPIPLHTLKYASRSHLDDLVVAQFRHLDSEIHYLNEALEYAKDGGFNIYPPTQQVVHKRLGQIHQYRGMLCFVSIQDKPLPSDMITYGIQAVLDYYQNKDISGEDSWRKAFGHLVECSKLSSRDMDRLATGSEPWINAATLTNILLLEMRKILHWRLGYLQLIKKNLMDHHERLTSDDELAILSYTQEFRSLIMSRIAAKEVWLNRMYTPPWEELSLDWPTVTVEDATWDLLKVDSWKETLTLASGCGIDVVVEYVLDISDTSPQKFLYICVLSQVHPPRFFVKEVDVDRLKTASMTSHSNPESGSFLENLECLHEILIKPILEDPVINTMHPQTLVFIPCELLEGVPFALLRDGAQPHGEGYLIQSYTISVAPSFRILQHCSQCVKDLQWLPLMPDASNASLVLSNPAIPKEEMEAGGSGPAFLVASQFPTRCKALYGSDSTVDSLLKWANLSSSSTRNEHCQAFFHFEAESGEGIAEGIAKVVEYFGPAFKWRVRMAVVRACQYSANGQMQKEVVLRLAREFLMRGVPCSVMSNYLVDDVSSDLFFTHLYTSLKNGEGVAAAVRHSMLEMKNEGFELGQWGAFSVFGDPTVRLPQEMLQSNQEL